MEKVAILIENLFNEEEFIYPYHRLRENYEVHLIGTEKEGEYKSEKGIAFTSTHASNEVCANDYLGVVIPGGYSPDKMRKCEATKDFLREMDQLNRPIAAICHGPWMLCSCANLKGKKVTSIHSIQDDLKNCGAIWIDEEVVIDNNYITSRTPKDLPAFMQAFLAAIEK